MNSGYGGSQFSNLRKDMAHASKTQTNFGAKAGLNNPAPPQQAFEPPALNSRLTNQQPGGQPAVADNVSAGGTRYVIGIKGGLNKFYNNNGESVS